MSGSCGWFPLRPKEIRAWVEAHRHELPTTLAQLAMVPIPFRMVIVKALSPDLRTALWREHLATFLGDGSALSPEQQAFVVETCEQIPNLLAAPAPNPTIIDWEARMARLFSRGEASRMFGTVGPPEPPEGLPLPPDALPNRA
jgi:hypothetical protein